MRTTLRASAFLLVASPVPTSPPTRTRPPQFFFTVQQTCTMSSPASRRTQRSSATPRRSTRNSAVPSSPLARGAEDQLRSEASQPRSSAQGTPRNHRVAQNVAASSPLFFNSPANGSSASANGAASSPPMIHSDVDGDRTPRASGMNMGGA